MPDFTISKTVNYGPEVFTAKTRQAALALAEKKFMAVVPTGRFLTPYPPTQMPQPRPLPLLL